MEQALSAAPAKPAARKGRIERAEAAVQAKAHASAAIDQRQRGSKQSEGEKATRKRRLLQGQPELDQPTERKDTDSIPVEKLTSENDT